MRCPCAMSATAIRRSRKVISEEPCASSISANALQRRQAEHKLSFLLAAFAFALCMLFPVSPAHAACAVPNTFSNGQPADATAVMGNFNALNDCVNSSVSPSGTPTAGNLPVFSSPSSITSGNLSGDCTTEGTLVVTCTRSNGAALGYFSTGTDAAQLTGTISVSRFDNGVHADGAHFLRGDGVWAIPPGGTGQAAGTPSVRASNIQSSNGSSYTVGWPAGTIEGDVVFILGEHGFAFRNPAGWTLFGNSAGSNANGFVIAKVMTAADISAGSVTITTTGAYYGVIAAVAIDGSTMTGVRQPAAFARSTSGLRPSRQSHHQAPDDRQRIGRPWLCVRPCRPGHADRLSVGPARPLQL